MKRYFYPASRDHHAYCMAKDFGMEFENPCGKWDTEWIPRLSIPELRFYIHADSLHLLEPMEGDLVIEPAHIRCLDKIGTVRRVTRDKQLWLEADYHDDGKAHEGTLIHKSHSSKVRILQRNGKPFMWPESGEA